MIFKVEFYGGQIDWVSTKDQMSVVKGYMEEAYNTLDELCDGIKKITEVSEYDAEQIKIHNTEYDPGNPQDIPEYIPLIDLATGDEFCIIASTDFE